MTLGERIRDMRKARGLSQEEVARRSGLSLKGMGDIERGSIEDPHYSSLKNIADALSVSVGILVGEEQQELAPLDEAPSGAGQSREWVDVSGSVKGTANVSGALLAGVNDIFNHLTKDIDDLTKDIPQSLAGDIYSRVKDAQTEIEQLAGSVG